MKIYHNDHARQPYDVEIYDIGEVTAETLTRCRCPEYHYFRGGQHHLGYFDLCMGFDIETYTQADNGYMYIWQFSFENIVIIGRQWSDFVSLLDLIKDTFHLTNGRRAIIFIANLGYEFQFMRKYLNITESFSKEERKPLYVVHNKCIEFRDALPISGGSLRLLADMYTNTQKAVGDLDYLVPRNSETELTDAELRYCYNDVIILSEFARHIFDTYSPMKFMPLTRTQILIREMKDLGIEMFGKKRLANMNFYAFPSKPMYRIFMQWLFRGGYVHGNLMYTADVFDEDDDVGSVDFTSSYPHSMTEYMPYHFRPLRNLDFENIKNLMESMCVVICATFYGLKNRFWHSIESIHKCADLEGAVIDNGRILKAKKMRVVLTELDYATYEEFYSCERIEVHWSLVSNRVTLPDYVLKPMFKYYTIKAEKKESGIPYTVEKSAVNSFFGCCAKKMSTGLVTYENDEWGMDLTDTFDRQRDRSILLPQWGIYISAHARRNLLGSIAKMIEYGTPNDALYCDTDSIKIRNYHKYEPIIKEYNERIFEHNNTLCEKYDLNYEIFKDLGAFDFEYQCLKLKYLGAKRYARDYIKKGKRVTEVTCAGVPKGKVNEYAESVGRDVYEIFTDKLEIPLSGKMTSFYNDEESSATIVDNQGHTVTMRELSNVGLVECSFTLTIEEAWKQTIFQMMKEARGKEFRLD